MEVFKDNDVVCKSLIQQRLDRFRVLDAKIDDLARFPSKRSATSVYHRGDPGPGCALEGSGRLLERNNTGSALSLWASAAAPIPGNADKPVSQHGVTDVETAACVVACALACVTVD